MIGKNYYIYMVTNTSRMLYVGLTTDLANILEKHREMRMNCFKGNFALDRLIYVEELSNIERAIKREQELKSSPRYYKMQLLNITNPNWDCLGDYWLEAVK